MSDEKFDKKIREAAERHHPAYDEKAWTKMEKLLDKHLPAENDRKRRVLFFLLIFLLLTGGGLVLSITGVLKRKSTPANEAATIHQPNEGKNQLQPVHTQQGSPGSSPSSTENDDANEIPPNTTGTHLPATTTTGPAGNPQAADYRNDLNSGAKQVVSSKTEALQINHSGKTGSVKPAATKYNKAKPSDIARAQKPGNAMPINKDKRKNVVTDTDPLNSSTKTNESAIRQEQDTSIASPAAGVTKNADSPATDNQIIAAKDGVADVKDSLSLAVSPATTIEPKDSEAAAPPLEKPASSSAEQKTKRKNSVFFTLSAGPDISYASGESLGKLRGLYGIGAGWNIGDKFTFRTGFYTVNKVYDASPAAYNPPPEFYNYYPYLEHVDAACRVYEIPFSVSYNFGKPGKKYWFASTGISSYLMKKETYNYSYKYAPGSPLLNQEWTIDNENKHFFSVLTLSGGYRRPLGKKAFFMIEPNLKLPLAGVGYGKVKLNSGGIIFSVGITPFGSGKK